MAPAVTRTAPAKKDLEDAIEQFEDDAEDDEDEDEDEADEPEAIAEGETGADAYTRLETRLKKRMATQIERRIKRQAEQLGKYRETLAKRMQAKLDEFAVSGAGADAHITPEQKREVLARQVAAHEATLKKLQEQLASLTAAAPETEG